MKLHSNPFIELYMTENIRTETFVKLFSPVLTQESHMHMLFQPGNIVLTGLQGSGKTALLNLMRPDVMITYRKIDEEWPLPEDCSRFISAGINLNSSKARDFGQRIIANVDDVAANQALLFGDFLNYWILDDLFKNIETICEDAETRIYETLQIEADQVQLNGLVSEIADHPCWFGAVEGISTYKAFRHYINTRIQAYRSFLNFNSELPADILQSKTSAGEPIAIVANGLKSNGILPSNMPLFVMIDQFEDLMGLEREDVSGGEKSFRGIIMKMISERDHPVSYRIGARPYSLYPDFAVFRAGSSAEEMRNFKIVDIEELLRGKEARKGLFNEFCEDVFRRRLSVDNKYTSNALRHVFGGKDAPADRARLYARTNRENVLMSRDDLPSPCAKYLETLASQEPLEARLGEAWYLQQSARRKKSVSVKELSRMPWTEHSKRWWKKERIQQALLQIAANQRQRMMWYGSDDILSLSGRNILVFLSICQFVWAEYLRNQPDNDDDLPEKINARVQDMGIQETSNYWFRKIKADPNGGSDRHRFANEVGRSLKTSLSKDKRMSYPGENGFSLPEKELEGDKELGVFLDRCVAYGVLETFPHTPKTKSRGQSIKWYLFPILTPYFQIPTPHTKEPKYVNRQILYRWLRRAEVYGDAWSNQASPKRRGSFPAANQLKLDIN